MCTHAHVDCSVDTLTCRFPESFKLIFLPPCSQSVLRGAPGHIRHFFGARFLVMGVAGIENSRCINSDCFKCMSQPDSRLREVFIVHSAWLNYLYNDIVFLNHINV